MQHNSDLYLRCWQSTPGRGFTLIELLIVIGLLGALAVLLLSNLNVNRTEVIDASLVQKELSDIQRAFQRFQADCVPQSADYKRMTQYGLDVLTTYETSRGWSFPGVWDPDRNKGWRGPYMVSEGMRTVNTTDVDADGIADHAGQPMDSAGQTIHVICTPYVNDEDGDAGDYYRVIPKASQDSLSELWVVFPSHSGALPAHAEDLDAYDYKRLLLIND